MLIGTGTDMNTSTHVHGCAKLKNDPGICDLVALAWQAANGSLIESNNTDYNRLFVMVQQQNIPLCNMSTGW